MLPDVPVAGPGVLSRDPNEGLYVHVTDFLRRISNERGLYIIPAEGSCLSIRRMLRVLSAVCMHSSCCMVLSFARCVGLVHTADAAG